ncbi:glycosyltransferase family 2 protein [Massilia aurea]|uniref:glycosyltransferase family A protein n=1 Tax=Massilia aurea TaxID=373040 RepID=UPI003462A048
MSSRDNARPLESLLARRDPHPGRHISVIVPTRNRHLLLERMLTRIDAQTFDDFEVIVVDDGSSLDTRKAYAGFQERFDSRFRVIELGIAGGPGFGPSVARNIGIDAASGDIVTFCDDDDVWTSHTHLAAMAEVFDSQPDVDLYIANQIAVSHLGVTERAHWLPALVEMVANRPRTHAHGYQIALDELTRAGGFAQLNILALRKSTAERIGGFWTRTSYEEDRDFFWRAADAARAVFFNPDLVAQHNVPDPARQNNLSRSFSQPERWLLSALVSQHIAMSVDSPAIRRLCQVYEGDILRHLSRYWSGQGRHALGMQYARRALAARASFKWAMYTGALAARQLIRGRA